MNNEEDSIAIVAAFFQACDVGSRETGGTVYSSQSVPGLSDIAPDIPLEATLHLLNGKAIHFKHEKHTTMNMNHRFLIQSCFKPLVFAYALEHGLLNEVHRAVGHTGDIRYGENTLSDQGQAYNPLINTGALAVLEILARNDHTIDAVGLWCRNLGSKMYIKKQQDYESSADGGETNNYSSSSSSSSSPSSTTPLFNHKAVLATEADSLRNRGLACMMAAAGVMTKTEVAVASSVKYYAAMDCLSISTKELARIASVFSHSNECLSNNTRSSTLAAMLHSGMYESSGTWMNNVGVPAKSGVSGAVFCVLPGIGGIAAYQPRIDEVGNSVQAMAMVRELVARVPSLNIFL
jgi:glutaminase